MPAVCQTYLAQPNVFLVNEAFRVSSGTYEIKDSAGAKLDLSALKTKQLSANANLSASVNSDGTITIPGTVYFAVRNVKQASLGSFSTMGSAPQAIPSADSQLLGKNIQVIR
jgi:hypothetical protein